MNNLTQIKILVKETLERDLRARNDDNYLYALICLSLRPALLCVSVGDFFLNHSEYGVPGFETVRRTRQKIQAEHPELRGEKFIEGMRMHHESVFKAFSKECS